MNTWACHVCKGLMASEWGFCRSPPGTSALDFLAHSRVFSAQIPCFSMPSETWQTIALAGVKPLRKPVCRVHCQNPEQLEKPYCVLTLNRRFGRSALEQKTGTWEEQTLAASEGR